MLPLHRLSRGCIALVSLRWFLRQRGVLQWRAFSIVPRRRRYQEIVYLPHLFGIWRSLLKKIVISSVMWERIVLYFPAVVGSFACRVFLSIGKLRVQISSLLNPRMYWSIELSYPLRRYCSFVLLSFVCVCAKKDRSGSSAPSAMVLWIGQRVICPNRLCRVEFNFVMPSVKCWKQGCIAILLNSCSVVLLPSRCGWDCAR